MNVRRGCSAVMVAVAAWVVVMPHAALAQDILEPGPVSVDVAHDPLPFVPGSWTMVVLPDTQNYVDTKDPNLFPGILKQMVNWTVANKDARQIGLLLQEGDIVDNNKKPEWEMALDAFGQLNGELPYVLIPGNHDIGPGGSAKTRETLMNQYFKLSDNPLNDPTRGGVVKGVYREGHLENSFAVVEANGRSLLILGLEFGPRANVVEWANGVVARPEYRDHTVILLTHTYLREGDLPDPAQPVSLENLPRAYRANHADAAQAADKGITHRYGVARIDPEDNPVHDGEELWQLLVSKHANFELVLCGHAGSGSDTGSRLPAKSLNPANDDGVATTARQISIGEHGNRVHEIVANYQFAAHGGNGWLRLMEFLPDGKTVQVKTYSPYLASLGESPWLTDARHQFVITLSDLPEED